MPPAHHTPITLTGPLRKPRQMLSDQSYANHLGLHDDKVATSLGFAAGPIEGPTHFSQFAPHLVTLWGPRLFEEGCLSVHFQNVVVEGEEVRASVEVPFHGASDGVLNAQKADGTKVLTGTACVGPPAEPTECERRIAAARPPERPRILDQLTVGQKGLEREHARLGFDTHSGNLYPFTLAEKLEVITEPIAWYTDEGAQDSPWKRPVVPFEMISVLSQYTGTATGFIVRQPAIGLFLDQEIRIHDGPVFVGEDYVIDREVIALGESRRTESYWVRTTIRRPADESVVATVLLHQGMLKESYTGV
jgi:hypothetical protein